MTFRPRLSNIFKTGPALGFVSALSLGPIFFLTASLLATPLPAKAALGETADSIAADGKATGMVRGQSTAFAAYRVEELSSPTAKIKQFVSPSGVIFGVAWSGRMATGVPSVLGAYQADFHAADQATKKRGGRIPYRKVTGAQVVVESWDLLRKIEGKAYVPALMPKEVSAQQIRIK